MAKFFCAVVGVVGSVFPVDIDLDLMVGDLKDAIKTKKSDTIKCDANMLQLFLARNEQGKWLDEDKAAAVNLDDHGHLEGFQMMKASLFLENPKYFNWDFEPKEGEVHVLVVVPESQTLTLSTDDRKRSASSGIAEENLLSVVQCGLKLSDADLAVGRLLKLPENLLGIDIQEGLYIRREYLDLFTMITKELASNRCARRVLVLGSPGIGKSVFGVFLFLTFMTERENIAYHPVGDSQIYYFTWIMEKGYQNLLRRKLVNPMWVYLMRMMPLVHLPTLSFVIRICLPAYSHPTTTISSSNIISLFI